jgi:hypothetical protein
MEKESKMFNEFPPIVNAEGYVHLHGPLRMDLAQDFWVYYDAAYWNGLETEEDIRSIRFYQCHHLEAITNSLHRVQVKNVLGLEAYSMISSSTVNPWQGFIDDCKSSNYLQQFDFEEYALWNINIQSDLGMEVIVKKGVEEDRIVMVRDWGFHRDIYYLTNIIVDK